jgi:hypothetical protein
MTEFQKPTQRQVMSSNGMSADQEAGTQTMMPPPFQLMASPADPPGGNPKKKAVPPTNDHPVSEEDRNQVRPKPVPAEIMREVANEVKGIEQLEICGEMIIVHSPCYSAEIEVIMEMVNSGEMEYEVGKQQILDRLTYLLQNEFKNADGEVNNWAETNKGEGTVKNEGNMGAEYYKMGQGGPQYLALTSWNDASDPSQGANNYTVYRNNPEVEEGSDQKHFEPSVQGGGIPFTSKNGEGRGNSKAEHTEEEENIDILMWIINLLGAGAGAGRKPAPIKDRSKTIGAGTPTLHDMSDDPKKETEEEKKKRKEKEKADAERKKGFNTRVKWKSYLTNGKESWTAEHPNLWQFLSSVRSNPNDRYEIIQVIPNNKEETAFSKSEIYQYVEKEKSKFKK